MPFRRAAAYLLRRPAAGRPLRLPPSTHRLHQGVGTHGRGLPAHTTALPLPPVAHDGHDAILGGYEAWMISGRPPRISSAQVAVGLGCHTM
ncbi:hypothetical protein E2562_024748 [Oryza meyeriana var. granulata]|uniref:Uncharacterized protein n=1 Tax=Oryza meyeriana var. granulata TaxID=110450 RepID=A0A6G1D875_9ORYZ|nr:hypothetical protein E2562_024748 [Oryza meyeriana var. granulata]